MITIPEIIKIIEENNSWFNIFYRNIELEVSFDERDDPEHYWIRIPTKYKIIPITSRLKDIKELFEGATDIMFVNGEPNFWAIEFRRSETRPKGRLAKGTRT